jgi:hypothetical protein
LQPCEIEIALVAGHRLIYRHPIAGLKLDYNARQVLAARIADLAAYVITLLRSRVGRGRKEK